MEEERRRFDAKAFRAKVMESAREAGMKVGDVERSAGLAQGYFSRMEKKGHSPSVESLLAIADALCADPAKLLGLPSEAGEIVSYIRKQELCEGQLSWLCDKISERFGA